MSDNNKGDVVRLKSGGPQMTVTETEIKDSGGIRVWCSWFDKSEVKQGVFPSEALEKT
tara:strand:+ start:148 stop:321 length:174 start_codon:yes stop_codon:yes gene_type:complete